MNVGTILIGSHEGSLGRRLTGLQTQLSNGVLVRKGIKGFVVSDRLVPLRVLFVQYGIVHGDSIHKGFRVSFFCLSFQTSQTIAIPIGRYHLGQHARSCHATRNRHGFFGFFHERIHFEGSHINFVTGKPQLMDFVFRVGVQHGNGTNPVLGRELNRFSSSFGAIAIVVVVVAARVSHDGC